MPACSLISKDLRILDAKCGTGIIKSVSSVQQDGSSLMESAPQSIIYAKHGTTKDNVKLATKDTSLKMANVSTSN